MKRNIFLSIVLTLLVFTLRDVSAHCDTMDGPVVKASQKALETGNVNYVLIWVRAEEEPDIITLFNKVIKVRILSPEAKDLADMYFFETVVRVHRMGEGEPYTGIKPAGYHPSEGIEAADVAIEKNSLSEILVQVPEAYQEEVKELFKDLQSIKDYNVNNLKAGRKYVEAYVHFIHYVEALFLAEDIQIEEHDSHSH